MTKVKLSSLSSDMMDLGEEIGSVLVSIALVSCGVKLSYSIAR